MHLLASLILKVSPQFQLPNIASTCIRMHRLASLISKCAQQFQLFLKQTFQGGGWGDPQPTDHFPISSQSWCHLSFASNSLLFENVPEFHIARCYCLLNSIGVQSICFKADVNLFYVHCTSWLY